MKKEEIKISIIIPVYNAEKTIKGCIESLQNQTYGNLEIICVDDCSTDSSIAIIKKVMENDCRIKLVNNGTNSGTLVTRKRGVEKASGDYILFADNDDWYELYACEKLVNEVKLEPTDVIMYSFRPVDIAEDSDNIEVSNLIKKGKTKPEKIVSINCIFIENRMNLLWNKLIKTDICKKAYSYTKEIHMTIGEDTYACWLIHYFAKSFRTIPDVLYNWNIVTGVSTKRNYSIEEFDNYCKSMTEYENGVMTFLDEVKASDDILNEFARSNKLRIETCVYICAKCVSTNDFPKAFKSIIKHFGEERTFSFIQNNLVEKDKSMLSLKKKYNTLKKKNEKIQSSNSYKLGKIITKPVRFLKKN